MGFPRKRYRSGTISIDITEYIEEIDDDVLLDEVKRRELELTKTGEAEPLDLVEEARRELLRGRPAEALVLLDRLVRPKWQDSDAARTAYENARKSA